MPSSSSFSRQPMRLHKKSTHRFNNSHPQPNPDYELDMPPPAYQPIRPCAEAPSLLSVNDEADDNVSLPSYHTHAAGGPNNASTRALFEYRPAEGDSKQPPSDGGEVEAQRSEHQQHEYWMQNHGGLPRGQFVRNMLRWPNNLALVPVAMVCVFWVVYVTYSYKQGGGKHHHTDDWV